MEQSRIQQLESIVARGIDRKNNLAKELEILQSEGASDEETKSLSGEITLLESTLVKLQSENKDFITIIDELRQNDQGLSNELDSRRSELQTGKGRLASLEALQQAALGRDNSVVSKWLSEKGLDDKKRLGESIKVDSGWEAAVEVVLGDSLQSICLENTENLEKLLKQVPKGMLSLLDTSSLVDATSSPKVGAELLSEKITANWKVGGLLDGVYGC